VNGELNLFYKELYSNWMKKLERTL